MPKQLFSNENIKKSGINLVAGYMSCPANTSTNHKGFFTTDADIPMAVSKFFGQMVVEVRPVLLLSKIANKLETKHILRFEVSQ